MNIHRHHAQNSTLKNMWLERETLVSEAKVQSFNIGLALKEISHTGIS